MRWLTDLYTEGDYCGTRLGLSTMPTGGRMSDRELFDSIPGAVIGDPQATDSYTVAELQAMGFVGVYKNDGS